jgi:hypothetical protein
LVWSGLGRTSPFTKLHVVGNSESPTGTYYGVMRIDTNTGANDVGYKLGAKAGAGTAGYSFYTSSAYKCCKRCEFGS